MRKSIPAVWTIVIFTCAALALPAVAEETKQLEWEDLIPKHLTSQDLLAGFTPEQKDLIIWVINMMESLPERRPETEEYFEEIDRALPSLKKEGIDIAKILTQRKKIRTAIVDDLNGLKVRIPGYLLPLEVNAAAVTEFLLVPYIGACIHVPPPPLNQIIYVKLAPKKGYTPKGLYEPVWVTGKISAKAMTRDLYLVDGSADIQIGYAINAIRIEPYQ